MNGPHIRFLHAAEKDGLDLKDRAIYLTENAAQAAKLASYIERFPSEANAHRARWEAMIHRIIDEIYEGRSYYTKDEWADIVSGGGNGA